MQKLLEPEAIELDAETQAAVDEVCGALADPWGAPAGLAARFGFGLLQALRYGSPDCRQRIIDAVEAGVRSDPAIWMQEGGICIPRQTIGQYRGRIQHIRDDTGEMREVLQWPTGTYASGDPSYERRDDAA